MYSRFFLVNLQLASAFTTGKVHKQEATMFCPKCKAKIGIHLYESRTLNHLAQGVTCCVCGYWREGGGNTAKHRKLPPK